MKISNKSAVTVVCVAEGYPGEYRKGDEITEGLDGELVFQAGTTMRGGMVLTDGGRVVAVTALGYTIEEAREKALETASNVRFRGKNYRKDIGNDLL